MDQCIAKIADAQHLFCFLSPLNEILHNTGTFVVLNLTPTAPIWGWGAKPSNIMSKSTERLTKLSRLKFKVVVGRGGVVMKHPVYARKFQLQVRDRPSYFQLTVVFSIRKCKNLSLQTCDWLSYKNVLFIIKRTPD